MPEQHTPQPADAKGPVIDLTWIDAGPQARYRGSMEPFEEIANALERIGVCFVLSIGCHGDEFTTCYTNADEWDGQRGIDAQRNAVNTTLDIREERLQDEKEDDHDHESEE